MQDLDFESLQLHAGQERADPSTGARAVPIYATSSYVFDSAQHAEDNFAGVASGSHGFQYGRMHNPTVQAFVDRMVALEGAEAGVAFSSGQAASSATLFSLMRPGGHVVVSNQVFGGTMSLFSKIFDDWGVGYSIVEPQAEHIAAAVTDDTLVVWIESIANPSCAVADIAAIAEVCTARQVALVVDNTWGCGGYLCRPLALGANIVLHSATKWIGGHGSFIGGVVLDGSNFAWPVERYPGIHKKDSRGRSYVDKAASSAFAARAWDLGLFAMGMSLAPQSAFLALQGLETLSLRVQRACDNALELAKWLEHHPQVHAVHYPGLAKHPCHEVATRQLEHGYGAVLSFETHTEEQARTFLDKVKLASHLANIGDSKTVVIRPWATTHAGLSPDARRAAGVSPSLIRVSLGLEAIQDITDDFTQALEN